MSIIPKQATGNGDYYLAPSVKFAKIGMGNHVTEMTYIDENGDNHYGLDNIFKTHLKVMSLDMHYNSSNARDGYVDMGHWRTSFTSRMDFPINEGDIKDKSNFYDTPRDACESGFADIKESAYRGILKEATSVYDKDHDMCILKQDGKDIGKFIVWNRSQKRDDVHYIETAAQEFLTFVKNDEGKFVSEQSGIVLELTQEENGAFSYKDAQDILRRYNSDGKLVYIMKEGQEAHLTYDESGKLDKVTGALDNVIDFDYNEDGLVTEISINQEQAKVAIDYDDKKLFSSFSMLVRDNNGTMQNPNTTNFSYTEKNLLSQIKILGKIDESNNTIPDVLMYFGYDTLNRVDKTESTAGMEHYKYHSLKVEKTLHNGAIVDSDIIFFKSKQMIKRMEDASILTEYDFNKEGLVSEVALAEEVEDNNSSNIQSNALSLTKTLNIQIDYNKKGLIKSQYLETSDGTKKFTNYEYKTQYNKPTKVLTEKDVTFFDFNNKGQLIKMSYLKYDKDMKLKSHALEDIKLESEYQEISYVYDKEGMLVKATDEVEGDITNFISTRNGESLAGNIQSNGWNTAMLSGWTFWNPTSWWTRWVKGSVNGTVYNVADANTKTAFISGAGGSSARSLYAWNVNNNSQHFHWESISYHRYLRQDIFDKGNAERLVVIGHSYGGDSDVEGACAPRIDKKVDLLITVDPVGVQPHMLFTRARTKFWINIYADAGRQWPGIKIKWKCGWWYCYPKFYYLDSQWHGSDWIAWLGGKGSYSSYGKYVPANKRITVRAHHDEVQIMVNDLQSKYGNNYDFNIRNYLNH